MGDKLPKENLKLFYYPIQALLARENTITMHNGHKQVNTESIDFYDVAAPKVALMTVSQTGDNVICRSFVRSLYIILIHTIYPVKQEFAFVFMFLSHFYNPMVQYFQHAKYYQETNGEREQL